MANENNFIVKFYHGDNVILDATIKHWTEYVAALNICNTVTLKDDIYNIKNINLVHANYNNGEGLIIELHVTVEPFVKRDNTFKTGKRITR